METYWIKHHHPKACTFQKLLHSVWKSPKKSHSTLRAKRAKFTFLSRQKLIKNSQFCWVFWKPEACSQTVLPVRSVSKHCAFGFLWCMRNAWKTGLIKNLTWKLFTLEPKTKINGVNQTINSRTVEHENRYLLSYVFLTSEKISCCILQQEKYHKSLYSRHWTFSDFYEDRKFCLAKQFLFYFVVL